MFEQEEHYDVLKNDRNELMFTIKARSNEPLEPKLLYDGGNHGLLYRTKEQVIVLDYINPGIRDLLVSLPQILVVEFEGENNIREYTAEVKKVKSLPLTNEKIEEIES